ncbi:MAG: hypothetical protein IKV97_04755 [Clostridia bacterium]|nr:hypothetical protein [Clostridia bacterium]
MKKILSVCLSALAALSCAVTPVCADDSRVTAVIPDYQVVIDGSSVYYADSLYPFLNYKGITYFPMTYDYCHAMDLTTGYLKHSAFMVAYQPSDGELPVYETVANTKYNTALIPTYNIYINGKKADNKNAEYPLINFRDITYFPMTWDYAVDEFGWQLTFENGILEINTGNNNARAFYIEEEGAGFTVLDTSYDEEIPLGDGVFTSRYVKRYSKLDHASGELSVLEDYTPSQDQIPANSAVEVTVKNGEVYYKENKLEGIFIEPATDNFTKPESIENAEYSVNAYTVGACAPLTVIVADVRTAYHGKEASWGTNTAHTYIEAGGKLIYLGTSKTVENVYTLGNDIFFNTVDYQQTVFKHYMKNRTMWKLSSDGTLSVMSYGGYGSIEIIGKYGNELYLKCLWCPENVMDFAPFSVSLVNDGYHTFDGTGIRFLSPYIYSDFDIVTENGDIFAVNNKLSKITKCELNPVYY